MRAGVADLTDREKQVLRLLARGYDAKSAAAALSLSVHTVNEYLRDARRKLEVSSSREAARLLAADEGSGPQSIGDKDLGDAAESQIDAGAESSSTGLPLVVVAGGSIAMLVIIGAAIYAAAHAGAVSQARAPMSPPSTASEQAQVAVATDWLSLVDHQRWDESWDATGAIFQAHVTKSAWGPLIRSAREPLGRVLSRVVESATPTTTLPGLPDGDYVVVKFDTKFEHKQNAVETLVVAHEPSGWRVDTYLIR